MSRFAVLILLTVPLLLPAEVFSLWPFSGNGSPGLEEAVQSASLWTEQVIVNGRSLELGVSLNRNSLDVCYRNLRKLYPDASFALNANSLLTEFKLKNGLRRRLYLLSVDGIYPVISFSMDLPPSGMKPDDWPAEFPLPAGDHRSDAAERRRLFRLSLSAQKQVTVCDTGFPERTVTDSSAFFRQA